MIEISKEIFVFGFGFLAFLIFVSGVGVGSFLREKYAFKPRVMYYEAIQLTEMVLEDTTIVWTALFPEMGHAVDLGYDFEGNLVGIKVWKDVRFNRGM